VSAVFHLNKNIMVSLNVNNNNETMPFCSEPEHLGVTLDRTLERIAATPSHFTDIMFFHSWDSLLA